MAFGKSLGETRLSVLSDRHGLSAFAVGVLRDISKKGSALGHSGIGCHIAITAEVINADGQNMALGAIEERSAVD